MTIPITAFTLAPLAWRPWLEPLDYARATPTSLLLALENAPLRTTAPGAPRLMPDPAVTRPLLVSAILDEPTGLPPVERELAAVIVSYVNGCLYSAAFYGWRFVQLTQTPTIIERIFAEGVDTPLDPRPRAIVDYAVQLTLMPDRLLRADLAQLRAVGLSDLEVLDLTHVVALVTWLNRLCQTLGEPVATADEPTSLP
jgi:uncharacterized peroxidase-related enzyme